MKGKEEFGGSDGLTCVALSVVGDVDEEAADGGGELLAADGARRFQIGASEIANADGGVVEAFVKFFEERSNGDAWFGFGLHGGELCLAELIVFSVGQQTVDTASDVADVKGERGQTVGQGVKVFLSKAEAPVVDIFGSEFESIEDGEVDGGEIFGAATEPGFDVRFSHIWFPF